MSGVVGSPVPLQNVVMALDLRGSWRRLCRPVVLVDHATEYLPALHWCAERHDDRLITVRRALAAGLVRPVAVVMFHVGAQDHP